MPPVNLKPLPSLLREAAESVLAYLAVADPLPTPAEPADAVMGFGLFDLKLPRYCGDIFTQGRARRIIFSGGIGVGTGNLVGTEADAWRAELRRSHPAIGDEHVVIENQSTNTGDNLTRTTALLARDYPALAFGRGIRRVILVASPSRLRRVRLTFRRQHPTLVALGACPPFTFDGERAAYAENGYDYVEHLAGELDRIVEYPARGFIAAEPLPPEIVEARALLRGNS
jgi:hypothetical protein